MARAPIALVVTALLAACGPAAQVGAEPAATPSAAAEAACAAPGGLTVAPSEERTPGVERRLIRREMVPLLRDDPRVVSFGTGADALTVDLRVDGEDLAAELVDRFGNAVAVTVGGAPYPPSKIPPSLRCPPLEIQPWPAGVRAVLELGDDAVAPGSAAGGVVTVINDSDRRFRTVTGVAEVALLFVPGTGRQVGHWTGAMQSSGRPVDLAPGQRAKIPVLVGLSSCTPQDGYAVPPGDYEARATVGPDIDGQRLSAPARIRVIPED